MKKSLISIAAVCAAACCFGACNSSCGSDKSSGEYDALNSMLKANYSAVTLTVTDKFDESTSLKSEYNMSFSDDGITVSYTVERFASVSLDAPATEAITTVTGEAVIKNGAVVSGELYGVVTLPDGLNFKEEYFENISLTGVYIRADVKNPGGFLGSEINCSGMKVNATFLEVFYDIQITYTAEGGNEVEYKYIFTV